ncbi:hypothetical protein IEE91_10225 [Kocuria sp. cx-455]|uniref:hypothetical protein n=1 Tax=Kocuria sp. cx-455 TaxID=2771377 RepID=UPI0016879B0E|nr:hypothetical protein [Kocuria sp. cx-455]MBD2765558.1 hypothetical protein [Kocuria sp. cx-455]
MDFLFSLMLFLHFLGLAVIIGTWIYTMKRPTVTAGQFWSAIVMLVSGLVLVALREMQAGFEVNHLKIAVKLIILLIVAVAAFIGMRKTTRGEPVSTGLAHSVGGMAVFNAAVAVFW